MGPKMLTGIYKYKSKDGICTCVFGLLRKREIWCFVFYYLWNLDFFTPILIKTTIYVVVSLSFTEGKNSTKLRTEDYGHCFLGSKRNLLADFMKPWLTIIQRIWSVIHFKTWGMPFRTSNMGCWCRQLFSFMISAHFYLTCLEDIAFIMSIFFIFPPACSSDLTVSDFHIFLHLKK